MLSAKKSKAIRSPRAKAHPVVKQKSAKQIPKKVSSRSINGSRSVDLSDNASFRSMSSGYSTATARSTRSAPRKLKASQRLDAKSPGKSRPVDDYAAMRIQLSDTLEENSLLKSRLHMELKERHLLDSKNKELSDKLIEAKTGLQQTGAALFKLQQATNELMSKRDRRDEQLQRALDLNKEYEVQIAELESKVHTTTDESKLQYAINNYRKIIAEKDEIIRRLEDEQLELQTRGARSRREYSALLEEKEDIQAMLESKGKKASLLEMNIKALEESNSSLQKTLMSMSANSHATTETHLSSIAKDHQLKMLEMKLTTTESENRILDARLQQLEAQARAMAATIAQGATTSASAPRPSRLSRNTSTNSNISMTTGEEDQQPQQRRASRSANGTQRVARGSSPSSISRGTGDASQNGVREVMDSGGGRAEKATGAPPATDLGESEESPGNTNPPATVIRSPSTQHGTQLEQQHQQQQQQTLPLSAGASSKSALTPVVEVAREDSVSDPRAAEAIPAAAVDIASGAGHRKSMRDSDRNISSGTDVPRSRRTIASSTSPLSPSKAAGSGPAQQSSGKGTAARDVGEDSALDESETEGGKFDPANSSSNTLTLELNQDNPALLARLLKEKKTLKRGIYDWNKSFIAKYKRDPTKEERVLLAKDLFKKYRQNMRALKEIGYESTRGGGDSSKLLIASSSSFSQRPEKDTFLIVEGTEDEK